jgi:hypothetical protein
MSNDKPKRPGLDYYQAASLVLLLVITGFSILGLWGLAGLVAPALTISSYEWRTLHSRSAFVRENYDQRSGLYYPRSSASAGGITVDDVTERWRDLRADALSLERSKAGHHVLLWLIAMIVCVPLYVHHHGVVRRALRASADEGA